LFRGGKGKRGGVRKAALNEHKKAIQEEERVRRGWGGNIKRGEKENRAHFRQLLVFGIDFYRGALKTGRVEEVEDGTIWGDARRKETKTTTTISMAHKRVI